MKEKSHELLFTVKNGNDHFYLFLYLRFLYDILIYTMEIPAYLLIASNMEDVIPHYNHA